ncbi:MAG: helix-turn-helix domain-containing protein, partial [Deinococcales bacterium]
MDSPQDEALFGRWLRKRRKALDLTQKLLARRVGCSPSTIRKLEADVRHPSRPMASALAGVLGVPEAERDAFIAFARGGWADRPPARAGLDFERPWLDGGRGVGLQPDASPPLGAAADLSQGPGRDAPQHHAPLHHAPQVHALTAPHVLARERELAWLDRELEQALAGHGRTALIAGQAGQGKTALMTAFAARAQAAHPELLVAVGSCNAYTGRGDPFLPVREIRAQLAGDVPTSRHLDA